MKTPLSIKRSDHLELEHGGSFEGQENVNKRFSLARRTLYSLIKTGMHGPNGLNPKMPYKMYQCCVMPKLLFGLESKCLHKKRHKRLNAFHLYTIWKL